MSAGLLRYRHLTIGQRLRVLTGGLKLLAMQRRDRSRAGEDDGRAIDGCAWRKASARAQAFWYPLSIATLNDEPEVSSAALLARSFEARIFFEALRFRIRLLARRAERSLLHWRRGNYRAQRRRRRDARCRSNRIDIENGSAVRVRMRDGTRLGAANIICATPSRSGGEDACPARCATIRSSRRSPNCKARRSFACMLGLIADVTDSAFVGFIGTTTQWLFNKRRIFEMHGERHPGYLSFVISGARKLVDHSNDELARNRFEDLRAMIPASSKAKLVRALVLKEKHATMAPAPDTYRLRPTTQTPIPNLFLAGDWVQTGLPATIESAVISGAPQRRRFRAARPKPSRRPHSARLIRWRPKHLCYRREWIPRMPRRPRADCARRSGACARA